MDRWMDQWPVPTEAQLTVTLERLTTTFLLTNGNTSTDRSGSQQCHIHAPPVRHWLLMKWSFWSGMHLITPPLSALHDPMETDVSLNCLCWELPTHQEDESDQSTVLVLFQMVLEGRD